MSIQINDIQQVGGEDIRIDYEVSGEACRAYMNTITKSVQHDTDISDIEGMSEFNGFFGAHFLDEVEREISENYSWILEDEAEEVEIEEDEEEGV